MATRPSLAALNLRERKEKAKSAMLTALDAVEQELASTNHSLGSETSARAQLARALELADQVGDDSDTVVRRVRIRAAELEAGLLRPVSAEDTEAIKRLYAETKKAFRDQEDALAALSVLLKQARAQHDELARKRTRDRVYLGYVAEYGAEPPSVPDSDRSLFETLLDSTQDTLDAFSSAEIDVELARAFLKSMRAYEDALDGTARGVMRDKYEEAKDMLWATYYDTIRGALEREYDSESKRARAATRALGVLSLTPPVDLVLLDRAREVRKDAMDTLFMHLVLTGDASVFEGDWVGDDRATVDVMTRVISASDEALDAMRTGTGKDKVAAFTRIYESATKFRHPHAFLEEFERKLLGVIETNGRLIYAQLRLVELLPVTFVTVRREIERALDAARGEFARRGASYWGLSQADRDALDAELAADWLTDRDRGEYELNKAMSRTPGRRAAFGNLLLGVAKGLDVRADTELSRVEAHVREIFVAAHAAIQDMTEEMATGGDVPNATRRAHARVAECVGDSAMWDAGNATVEMVAVFWSAGHVYVSNPRNIGVPTDDYLATIESLGSLGEDDEPASTMRLARTTRDIVLAQILREIAGGKIGPHPLWVNDAEKNMLEEAERAYFAELGASIEDEGRRARDFMTRVRDTMNRFLASFASSSQEVFRDMLERVLGAPALEEGTAATQTESAPAEAGPAEPEARPVPAESASAESGSASASEPAPAEAESVPTKVEEEDYFDAVRRNTESAFPDISHVGDAIRYRYDAIQRAWNKTHAIRFASSGGSKLPYMNEDLNAGFLDYMSRARLSEGSSKHQRLLYLYNETAALRDVIDELNVFLALSNGHSEFAEALEECNELLRAFTSLYRDTLQEAVYSKLDPSHSLVGGIGLSVADYRVALRDSDAVARVDKKVRTEITRLIYETINALVERVKMLDSNSDIALESIRQLVDLIEGVSWDLDQNIYVEADKIVRCSEQLVADKVLELFTPEQLAGSDLSAVIARTKRWDVDPGHIAVHVNRLVQAYKDAVSTLAFPFTGPYEAKQRDLVRSGYPSLRKAAEDHPDAFGPEDLEWVLNFQVGSIASSADEEIASGQTSDLSDLEQTVSDIRAAAANLRQNSVMRAVQKMRRSGRMS